MLRAQKLDNTVDHCHDYGDNDDPGHFFLPLNTRRIGRMMIPYTSAIQETVLSRTRISEPITGVSPNQNDQNVLITSYRVVIVHSPFNYSDYIPL